MTKIIDFIAKKQLMAEQGELVEQEESWALFKKIQPLVKAAMKGKSPTVRPVVYALTASIADILAATFLSQGEKRGEEDLLHTVSMLHSLTQDFLKEKQGGNNDESA